MLSKNSTTQRCVRIKIYGVNRIAPQACSWERDRLFLRVLLKREKKNIAEKKFTSRINVEQAPHLIRIGIM